MKIKCITAGNIDHGQNPYEKTNSIFDANNIEECQKIVEEYIEDNDLGGGNWIGGFVYEQDNLIAVISYNGRVWESGSKYFEEFKNLLGGN